MTTYDFNTLLKWKLRKGSHEFPGKQGGTCINEAAIVAAGFEYRSIAKADDCPPCFSRPIAQYALSLNDAMPARHRQKLLMPFVTRLSGTADKEAVEARRVNLIVLRTIREIAPMALRLEGLEGCALICEKAELKDSFFWATIAMWCQYSAPIRVNSMGFNLMLLSDVWLNHLGKYKLCAKAADLAHEAATAHASIRSRVYRCTASILDEAIRIGNHADEEEPPALVAKRMRSVMEKVA